VAAIRRLQGGQTAAEVARALEVHPTELYRWRQELDIHGERAFQGVGKKRAEEGRARRHEDRTKAQDARLADRVLRARRGVSTRMIMPQDDGGAAGGEGCPKEGSHIDAGDRVLGADGDDVSAGDLVVAVHEEGREVLAVGECDERLQRARAGSGVGEDRLGEAERATGLHEAHFVDGDFLERCLGRVHGGTFLAGEPLSVGSFVPARSARRSLA